MSPALLSVAGFDGYLKRFNPAFAKVFGYSREELLSRPWIEFAHPDDREQYRVDLLRRPRTAIGCAIANTYRPIARLS